MATTVPSNDEVIEFLRHVRHQNPSFGTAKLLDRVRAERPSWTIGSKRLRTLQVQAGLQPIPEAPTARPHTIENAAQNRQSSSSSDTSRSKTAHALPKTSTASKLGRVVKDEQNPRTMSVDSLIAFLSARGLSIPTKEHDLEESNINNRRKRLIEDVSRRPNFDPIRRWLYIPQDPNEPCLSIAYSANQTRNKAIEKLLRCRSYRTEQLYAEDQAAIARGLKCGVGLGHLHRSWELFLDDRALLDRPLNQRASTLLCRPQTHGPVLVSKAIFQKVITSPFIHHTNDMGLVGWEPLDELELEGARFQRRREEWIRHRENTQRESLGILDYVKAILVNFGFMSL